MYIQRQVIGLIMFASLHLRIILLTYWLTDIRLYLTWRSGSRGVIIATCKIYTAAVRCCAVRCGAVRCGAVRCGAVRCGAVRCGAARCCVVRCGVVRGGAVRCGGSCTVLEHRPPVLVVNAPAPTSQTPRPTMYEPAVVEVTQPYRHRLVHRGRQDRGTACSG